MIRRLVLRSLRHRPGRSLLLLAGYALGVGVTVALLSIGSALVQQSRDRTLVGGGDLTVLPAGLDLETFRTGGASSLYFSIDQAPYLYRQVLTGPRFRERVAAAAPWIDDEVLYLEVAGDGDDRGASGRDGTVEAQKAGAADRLLPVSAGGRIPSLARRLGAETRVTEGAWRDAPADRRWAAPDDSTLYAGLDAFHLPPPTAAADGSWAEWHYFNVLLPEDRGWLYLTYMVAGDVPDGRWGGRLLATLVTRGEDGGHRSRAFVADVPARDVNFSLARPDLRIGGSSLTLEGDGRYRLRAEIPPVADGEAPGGSEAPSAAPADRADRPPVAGSAGTADGPRLHVDLTLEGDRRAHLPPLDVGRGDFPSGYVVPMLDARAAGRVCLGEACREIEGTRAYHDHNWGTWAGVTWDWGQARAGPYRLLYGGVRRDPAGGGADGPSDEARAAAGPGAARGEAPASPDEPGAGRRFLFVTDSLGFAGLFTVDRLEHRWRAAYGGGGADAGGGATYGRRPVGLTVAAARGRDTVRLRADIRHARATRQAVTPGDSGRLRLFWQMRGAARLEGRLHGRPVAARGDGFFETWTAGASPDAADAGTYLERNSEQPAVDPRTSGGSRRGDPLPDAGRRW